MTKDSFCAAAAGELQVTHPQLSAQTAAILLGHAHDGLLGALGLTELNEDALAMAEEWAVWQFNRLGSEGLSEEAFSGVVQRFSDRLPETLRREIRRRRKVEWK